MERKAIASFNSFIELYISIHECNNHFSSKTLEEILHEQLTAPLRSRKLIALYLHNSVDPFSYTFCSIFDDEDTKVFINDTCTIVGWDISYEHYHNDLSAIIDKCLRYPSITVYIRQKRACLIILQPFDANVNVYSTFLGDDSLLQIKTALQTAKKEFHQQIKSGDHRWGEITQVIPTAASENVLSDSNSYPGYVEDIDGQDDNDTFTQQNSISRSSQNSTLFNAVEYQQEMLDRLGDRDYDCFEYDEHIHLKSKIGFAKYGPPQQTSGYDAKQQQEIEETFLKILENNNQFAKWKDQVIVSFIYNCLEPLEKEKLKRMKKYKNYDPYSDIMPIPLFIIKKCYGSSHPCRIVIDSDNRIYDSWKDYIQSNKLHKCLMILPMDGKYTADLEGNVVLEKHLSPAAKPTEKLLRSVDTVSSVAGIGSGVVFGISLIPAIAVAPAALVAATVVGIGVAGYSVSRSIMTIHDKRVHGETLSFTDSEARGAYLNILAGTLGFVGAGATGALTYCASNGIKVGQGAVVAVNTINATNIGVAAGSIGNTTYQVINDWVNDNRSPSLLTIVQLSSSILFFGNAVYNFRSASTIIDEAQRSTLSKYSDSLRSNRHRKMLNKMTKETIRQQGGNTATGQAEVISSLKNIPNKDETFAILTRNNKLFNKHGIRFSSEGGQIKLNGMSVDLTEFGGMSRIQKSQLLIDLPTNPQPSKIQFSNNMRETAHILQSLKSELMLNLHFSGIVMEMVTMETNGFSEFIKKQLIKLSVKLLSKVLSLHVDFEGYFQKFKDPKVVIILRIVIEFFKYQLNNYEIEYQRARSIAKSKPGFDERSFNSKWGFCGGVTPSQATRAIEWFERAVLNSKGNENIIIESLLTFFVSKLSDKILNSIYVKEQDEKRSKHSVERTNTIKCNVCRGYYYV